MRSIPSHHRGQRLLADLNPQIETWKAIAVLLADRGPRPRLDDALDHLRSRSAERDASTEAGDVIAYQGARSALV
ncbi:hypothetical protein OH799_16170 [Nocardia sp. NBC_00881]|uniref:hypothetical protein n=1 Tax=Nocardia sp. NBC_00881 TaxID=2975995 RepID=UPI0038700289|nr:hypothetical protein OH799_16170 [Nocardia sp. NBC_00881]